MTAARSLIVGDPEPLTVYVHAYGADGKHVCTVAAKSAESAKSLLAERSDFELVYLRGPGVPERVWRDATSRAWRTK